MSDSKYSFRISVINNFNVKEVHVNENGKLIVIFPISYLRSIYHRDFIRIDDEMKVLEEACNWLLENYSEELL